MTLGDRVEADRAAVPLRVFPLSEVAQDARETEYMPAFGYPMRNKCQAGGKVVKKQRECEIACTHRGATGGDVKQIGQDVSSELAKSSIPDVPAEGGIMT